MKGSGIGQMKHSMNNLFLESATMPPNVKDILNRRGDAIVNSIKIGRTPVQSAIQGILKTLSTVPYDRLFHLFMVFKTSKGEILFEKNARINASTTIPKSEDWYDLNNVPRLTLNDYIQNTKKFMGPKMFPYHPSTNNCQDFISSVLQANGIRDQNVYNFVKQDTTMIFKNKGWLSNMAKQVTDLGGYADVILQGGSLRKGLSNELTNDELSQLVKHYKIKKYHGAFIDDRMPTKLKNGFYIINLNGRSHWTCLMKDDDKFYYFDSYGFVASQEVEDQIGEYMYSDLQLQHLNSSSCGFFVIAWMRYMQNHKHKDKKICYKSFLKLFSNDPKENELILNELLS
jgi:hypothetical protein